MIKKLEAYCLLEDKKAMVLSKHLNKLIASYGKELMRRKNKSTWRE
ncbi:hypothetical protein [Marinifilum sp. D737]|nr:hypothetical protein [Marinifilum sp. D737]MCY1633287.1 hypothetical protein [Marinifilum sp. D737]